jgi:hypothetical protein
MDTLTHSGGDTLDSIIHTEVAAFTPTASGNLTVEIDGVLQEPDTYTVSGNQIIFDTAPANGVTTTAFLHSEEADYTFDITATDPVNTEFSERTFSMFVNAPGIAWISPQRTSNTVLVNYNEGSYQTLDLIAATYNQTGGTYEEVSLALIANPDTIDNSGLSFSSGSPDTLAGTVTGSLEGTPTSIGEATDYSITLRAAETNNSSYNNERTLIIRMLEDPNYLSPS